MDTLGWLMLPFAGVFGAIIGSFLNAFIYRWPLRISLWKRRRSFCPLCKHDIAWYDNIPILSYLLLLGRCRHCRGRIHPRYMAVEIITAGLFILIYYQEMLLNCDYRGPRGEPPFDWLTLCVHLAFISALIGASFVDCLVMRLPNEITVTGSLLAPLLCLLIPRLHPAAAEVSGYWRLDALLAAFAGMLAAAGALWFIGVAGEAILKKPAMGFGDVKLMCMVGGVLGVQRAVLAILLAALIGALIGSVNLMLTGRHKIPFGPFLVAGSIMSLIWGPALISGYLALVSGYAPAPAYLSPVPW